MSFIQVATLWKTMSALTSWLTDDPTEVMSNPVPDPTNPNLSPDTDFFCSGHSFLADGRLVLAGGTQHSADPVEATPTDPHGGTD